MTGLTLAGVAKALGKSDHTTVINAIKNRKEMENSSDLETTISVLKKRLILLLKKVIHINLWIMCLLYVDNLWIIFLFFINNVYTL